MIKVCVAHHNSGVEGSSATLGAGGGSQMHGWPGLCSAQHVLGTLLMLVELDRSLYGIGQPYYSYLPTHIQTNPALPVCSECTYPYPTTTFAVTSTFDVNLTSLAQTLLSLLPQLAAPTQTIRPV